MKQNQQVSSSPTNTVGLLGEDLRSSDTRTQINTTELAQVALVK